MKANNILQKTQLTLVSILLFLTPLIFTYNTNELFEFPKMFFVYFTGSILVVIWTIKGTINREHCTHINIFATTYFIGVLISTLFSSHLYTSLWGYYSRFNGGFISFLIFFGIFLTVKNLKHKKLLLIVPKLTLIPISIFGIYQHFNGELRVFSTIGQPNWLASYISMVLLTIVHTLITQKKDGQFPDLPYRLYWVLYILAFSTLWFTYSLSGLLGFVVGFTTLILIIKKNLSKKHIIIMIAISIFISSTSSGLFKQKFSDALFDAQKFISYKTNVYAQDGEETHKVSDPGFIRKGIWEGTLMLYASQPKIALIGIGPETFPYEFQKFRPPELNYSSEWDFILNKPHNYYLEVLVENGALGFIPYILLIYWTLKKKHPIFTPALASFYVSNFFSWPTVSTALLFWCWLGAFDESHAITCKANQKSFTQSKLAKIAIIMTLIAAEFVLVWNLYKMYTADIHNTESKYYLKRSETLRSLEEAQKAVSNNPMEPSYYRGRARAYLAATIDKDPESTERLKQKALRDLHFSYDLNPTNLATIRNNIPLYYFLASEDLSERASKANIDYKFLPVTRAYLNKVKGDYSKDAGALVTIAKYEKRLQLDSEYKETVEMIRNLRPDLLEWYPSLMDYSDNST